MSEACGVLEEQEAQKLVDMDRVQRDVIERVEQAGIGVSRSTQ